MASRTFSPPRWLVSQSCTTAMDRPIKVAFSSSIGASVGSVVMQKVWGESQKNLGVWSTPQSGLDSTLVYYLAWDCHRCEVLGFLAMKWQFIRGQKLFMNFVGFSRNKKLSSIGKPTNLAAAV